MTAKKRQIDKFMDAARELECDEDENRFKKRLARLVRPGAKKNTDGENEDKV